MFYLFGINGPMYQGSADRLSHITAVRRRPACPWFADRCVWD